MKKIALAFAAPLILAACVNPEKVAKTRITDANMTCQQIAQESAQIERLKKEAKKGTGMSAQNVAAAVLFWPAAVGNYMNGQEALEAAHAREAVLAGLGQRKGCNFAAG